MLRLLRLLRSFLRALRALRWMETPLESSTMEKKWQTRAPEMAR